MTDEQEQIAKNATQLMFGGVMKVVTTRCLRVANEIRFEKYLTRFFFAVHPKRHGLLQNALVTFPQNDWATKRKT